MHFRRVLARHASIGAVEGIVRDLASAGWHIVSTPVTIEMDDPPISDGEVCQAAWANPTRIYEMSCTVDDKFVSTRAMASRQMLAQAANPDGMSRAIRRKLTHELSEQLLMELSRGPAIQEDTVV